MTHATSEAAIGFRSKGQGLPVSPPLSFVVGWKFRQISEADQSIFVCSFTLVEFGAYEGEQHYKWCSKATAGKWNPRAPETKSNLYAMSDCFWIMRSIFFFHLCCVLIAVALISILNRRVKLFWVCTLSLTCLGLVAFSQLFNLFLQNNIVKQFYNLCFLF